MFNTNKLTSENKLTSSCSLFTVLSKVSCLSAVHHFISFSTCPAVSCLPLYSTLLEHWIRISFLDHKSFSYLILSMTISSCLLFFLLLCMRALSPFSPFVRLTCPVRWYQLVPHKPFGTLLAGVSATGSNDPAGSTGTRPTYVFFYVS